MNLNRKDIITGAIVVIILIIAGSLLVRNFRNRAKNQLPLPTSVPTSQEIKSNVAEKFKFTVPADGPSIDLRSVDGGDEQGLATETEVLADLSDPQMGEFYQAWLEKEGALVSLGKMTMAKGGWLISYNKDKYKDYDKVVVSLEKTFDNKIEKKILEGSF